MYEYSIVLFEYSKLVQYNREIQQFECIYLV